MRHPLASVLAGLAAAQALLILLPMPTWTLWMAHFAALETSLVAALLGLAAIAAGARSGGHIPAMVGAAAAIVGLAPLLSAAPVYWREGASFSLLDYATGGSWPEIAAEEIQLDEGVVADVYRPTGPGPHGAVVVVHGGSWRAGDKGEVAHVSKALAAAGLVVYDVVYGLAPAHPFPEGPADVKCSVGRIRERAGVDGFDPDRMAILGRSAGGHLALLAAGSVGDPAIAPSCAVPDLPVRAVVGIYPPTDLVAAHDDPLRPDVVDGPAAVRGFLGGPPSDQPERYALAGVVGRAGALPPTLLVHGSGERVVRPTHSRWLAEGMRKLGKPVHLLEIPMADHGFDLREGGVGEQLSRQVILRFLAEEGVL